MSDMSEQEMLKRPKGSEMNPVEVAPASALLEGQQEGVAEARQAREADYARRMEELSQEVEQLTAEIAEQDNILAVTQASMEKSQKFIIDNPDSPAVGLYKQTLALSQEEIDNALDKKAELAGKKSAFEELRKGLMN